ncbi:MAG TPA: class I SAM-dependent methyltransferase [Alphaproteobacteria bacterium]|nr:class I SAM-dependent methyltransferase [Alphaproteobacteria bacterium]
MTMSNRTAAHWEAYPCGIHLPVGKPGTREFYTNLRRFKYEVDYPEILRMARFEEGRGRKVLEVGCGLGSDTQTWLEHGADLTSIDFAERAVEETNNRLRLFGLPPVARRASALDLPFPDASFDIYYAWGVLMHTGDTERALAEAHRVLRPGGTLIVMLYNKNSLSYRLHVQLLGRSYDDGAPITEFYTNGELRRMLRAFSISEFENYYFMRPNISRIGRYIPPPVERLLGRSWGACTYARGVKEPSPA